MPQDTTPAQALTQPSPIITYAGVVEPEWADFNGHMTEWRYLKIFADSSERVMELLGCDQTYIRAGHSFFTAETHVMHTDEVRVGAPITCRMTVLRASGKLLHIWQEILSDGHELAVAEQVLIHVSLTTRKAAPALGALAENMAQVQQLHAALPRDARLGRAIRVR